MPSNELKEVSNVRSATESGSAARSLSEEFVDSFKFALIQSPLDGVTQLVDHFCLTDLNSKAQFFKAPKMAEYMSGSWIAPC